MVEDIIFNLVNDIDIIKTKERIQKYEHDNAQTIRLNQYKRDEAFKSESISIQKEQQSRQNKAIEYQVIFKNLTFYALFWPLL